MAVVRQARVSVVSMVKGSYLRNVLTVNGSKTWNALVLMYVVMVKREGPTPWVRKNDGLLLESCSMGAC